jgi:hypothetical protein
MPGCHAHLPPSWCHNDCLDRFRVLAKVSYLELAWVYDHGYRCRRPI